MRYAGAGAELDDELLPETAAARAAARVSGIVPVAATVRAIPTPALPLGAEFTTGMATAEPTLWLVLHKRSTGTTVRRGKHSASSLS